jgi:hypothetical protein
MNRFSKPGNKCKIMSLHAHTIVITPIIVTHVMYKMVKSVVNFIHLFMILMKKCGFSSSLIGVLDGTI